MSTQAPQDLNKLCSKKGRTQPFLLATTLANGCTEAINLVIDKVPLMTFKESSAAIAALIGSYFIFDLEYPNECAGTFFFLQEFVTQMSVNKSAKYSTYQNACIGILSNKELN